MYNEKWFTSRGFKKLDYQETTINEVLVSLKENEITILAACPSAGKTLMAINVIEEYLKEYPDNKVLVLAHGTTVLRSQFYNKCLEAKPDFIYKLNETRKEYNKNVADKNVQVNITLPQTIYKGSIEHADFIVIDEGHQLYFAKSEDGFSGMVQSIIEKAKPTKQLILTGTPSKFILRQMPIIPVTINQIMDSGMIANLNVEIACSNYDFKLGDFDREGGLNRDDFNEKDTNETLKRLLKRVMRRLKSRSIHQYVNFFRKGWFGALREMKKTMIACRSQQQAMQVKKYFESQNVSVALSISDIAGSNEEIERFKNDEKCLVLIVVRRGILGFDYPDLINGIDMTMSYNIDSVYQLMCRFIRKNPTNDTKLFFKIAPTHLRDYYKYIMTAVLCMSEMDFFIKFNGKNLREMEIPTIKIDKEKKPREQGDGKKRKSAFKPIMFDDLMVFDLIKGIYHTGNDILEAYGFTTIQSVRNEFLAIIHHSYTKEEIHQDALKHNSKSAWIHSSKESSNMAQNAFNKGWFNEVTSHMKNLGGTSYSKEEVHQDALKFKTISSWYSSSKPSRQKYRQSRENGWFEEVTSHMKRLQAKGVSYSKEEVHQDALRFNTIHSWINSNARVGKTANMYNQARQKGWLEDVTSHMEIPFKKNRNFTKEEIHQDALKFNTSAEWKRSSKTSGGMYNKAGKFGWLQEVTSHMTKFHKNTPYKKVTSL